MLLTDNFDWPTRPSSRIISERQLFSGMLKENLRSHSYIELLYNLLKC